VRFVRALAASLSLASGVACGGGDLALPTDQSPSEITVLTGNGQVGAVGAELSSPLVVLVEDALGEPVANVRVAFKLGAGAEGGSTAPDTAVTDADGEASATWVLGGAEGRQVVTAEVVGEDLVVSFSAQAERTSELTLEPAGGDEQSGEPGAELANPLVVRLVDEGGEGVGGRAVAWVVATGGGTANPETSTTDGDGFASTRWTLGEDPGDNRLNAVVSGIGVVSFTATAVGDGAGEPSADLSTISASPGSIEAGTGQSTITVTVRDGAGAPIQGATVTLSASGSGNVLNQPSDPTDADGVTTGRLGSLVPETKVITAVVNGAVTLTQVAEVTVTLAPEPDHLVFLVQPTDTDDGDEISPAVEIAIVHAGGDLVPLSGVVIEVEFIRDNGNDHQFDGDATRTTVAGVAVFPDLSVDHNHDDFRIRAFAPDRPELGTVLSNFFDVED
jgi:Bacterial Ig-like domain (group 1)